MIGRRLRRSMKPTIPMPAEDDQEDEFEPRCARAAFSGFRELELPSSEPEPNDEENEEEGAMVAVPKKKKNKRRKKLELTSSEPKPNDEENEEEGAVVAVPKKEKNKKCKKVPVKTFEVPEQLDEVDRCVQEVNEMLGDLDINNEPTTSAGYVFSPVHVEVKHLNVYNEYLQKFSHIEEIPKKSRTTISRIRYAIVPEEYRKGGIDVVFSGSEMELLRTENGIKYFAFNHSVHYQTKILERLLLVLKITPNLEEHLLTNPNATYEAYLQTVDLLMSREEFVLANQVLEEIIFQLQKHFHRQFTLTDPNIRLEYKYFENEAFHIALFKYSYCLANRGLYRTALEIMKLLLKLDPMDPLGVLLCIDIMALKAYQFDYFLEAFGFWTAERNADMLPNMLYTAALCQLYGAQEQGRAGAPGLARAAHMLTDALVAHPMAAKELMFALYKRDPLIHQHEFFKRAEATTSNALLVLHKLYAKLTIAQWRLRETMAWLVETVTNTLTRYDTDPDFKQRVEAAARVRRGMFLKLPGPARRHMLLLKPMAGYLNIEPLESPNIHVCNLAFKTRNHIDRNNYAGRLAEFYESVNDELDHEPQDAAPGPTQGQPQGEADEETDSAE